MRSWWSMWVVLGACAEDPGLELTGDELPPPTLELAVSQMVGGSRARVTTAPAGRGDSVIWLLSTTGPGRTCPPGLGGQCVGLAGPVHVIGGAPGTVDDWASLVFGVPRAVRPGRTVWVQAVKTDPAGNLELSPVVDRTTGPLACPAIFMPVCGFDGQTYGNDCEAAGMGMLIDHSGPC